MNKTFQNTLYNYILAGQSMLYVNSVEETRVLADITTTGWLLAGQIEIEKTTLASLVTKFKTVGLPTTELENKQRIDATFLTATLQQLRHKCLYDKHDDEAADELRVQIVDLLDNNGFPVICWDQVSGISTDGTCAEDLRALMSVIGDAANPTLPTRCIVVVKDAHYHINTNESPSYRRAIRNLYEDNRLVSGSLSRHIIFLQPYMKPHEDVRHCFVRLDYPLPTDEEIANEISEAQLGIQDANKRKCSPELKTELVSALRGMDIASISTTLAYCIVDFGGFIPSKTNHDGSTSQLVQTVRSARSKQLTVGQGMRIIDPDDPELLMLGSLSGYENVKELANRVLFCRTSLAKQEKLKVPSGFAIAGSPGSGKTVAGKLFARWLSVPLVMVNLGTVKEGIVGASEHNMARLIETIWALGDCVVLFDEWDKQSGGIIGSSSDGNTSSGMLSMVLDFASDPRRKAFLIFTINRLHGPIESLRTGRISRFFYTPLPDESERLDILKLKLTEQAAEAPSNLKDFAFDNINKGLSGAELTGIVDEAIILAVMKFGCKKPTIEEFYDARAVVTPVTALSSEEIQAMNNFKDIAVSVNKPKKTKQVNSRRNIGLN